MEINVEDPGIILVGHTGKILAVDEIDYFSEVSLCQKPTGKCEHSSWFLMQMHRNHYGDIDGKFYGSMVSMSDVFVKSVPTST
ncbi:hypothetical protein [Psychrobacillus antarcticus]|uniref:hypothetical protein n=1 Tax=Psychrobacillus antarcticus TaxID=2879115 RepID=UPI0024081891|nr:hypothetical protein [Psychrobacillus antarcticus]